MPSILAWRILVAEEAGVYSPWGHKELDTTEQLSMHAHQLVMKYCPFVYWKIQVKLLLEILSIVFIRDIGLHISFPVKSLPCFCIRVMLVIQVGKCCLLIFSGKAYIKLLFLKVSIPIWTLSIVLVVPCLVAPCGLWDLSSLIRN